MKNIKLRSLTECECIALYNCVIPELDMISIPTRPASSIKPLTISSIPFFNYRINEQMLIN